MLLTRYRSSVRIAGALAISVAFACAQSDGPKQVFEVASVRISGPDSKRDSDGGPGTHSPTLYHFDRATLRDLISQAYEDSCYEIISKTELDRDRFDVRAKVPPGATREQFRAMLRDLLSTRFSLEARTEVRDLAAWEMTVAKGGLKITESGPAPEVGGAVRPGSNITPDGFPVLPAGMAIWSMRVSTVDGFPVYRLAAQYQPVSVLADTLSSEGDPPIVDKTGLTGKYSFRLEYLKVPLRKQTSDNRLPPAPELFTALEQQLGLRLTPKKLPFTVVVVDSVSRFPTEN
jgi:uncharacterized protein (TIGR03435 family)